MVVCPLTPGGIVYVDPVFPADFNGDGLVDLLVEGVNQPSRLFLNTGPAGGGRLVEVRELLPDSAGSFAVADLNGDGSPDIVAWNANCCNPSLLESCLSGVRKFTFPPDLILPIPRVRFSSAAAY
jgi:VCBS repeat protein